MRRWILALAAVVLSAQSMGVVNTMTVYGITEDDIITVINAARDGDKAAVGGLLKRGRIKPIMKGTKVEVVIRKEHASRIRIASGEDINIRGWIPTAHIR